MATLTKKDLLEAIEDMPKWEKVTEENYKLISEIDCGLYPIMFARKTQIGDYVHASYGIRHTMGISISDMAKANNYYYMILPKLT